MVQNAAKLAKTQVQYENGHGELNFWTRYLNQKYTVAVSAHAQKQIRQTNSRSEVVVHMPKLHVQK